MEIVDLWDFSSILRTVLKNEWAANNGAYETNNRSG